MSVDPTANSTAEPGAHQAIWISRLDETEIAHRIARATGPLAGWRVGVKDNVDVAGFATTAGCPSYAYEAQASAPSVQRLVDAGAVVVGKTNLDQFATGLVGTRSPYGAVVSPVAPGRVSGGSSSGSAAAVAAGEVDIAIGTDTAGSGRVPAAFCGVVGLKGTRGWIPTAGTVPACPSFDCVTVFARTIASGAQAMSIMAGPEPTDPASRTPPPVAPQPVRRVGVPALAAMDHCDERTRAAFATAVLAVADAGFEVFEVDLGAYFGAGDLLYGGSFVAERTASVGAFLATNPVDADPTVASIIAGGTDVRATDYLADVQRLAELRMRAAEVWHDVDAVVLPTAPLHPTIADVAADPLGVNSALGRFVSGCNLVDWCAVAIPMVSGDDGPFGIQILGPAWSDLAIWQVAATLLGEQPLAPADGLIDVAVLGAHLEGQPLNHQLTDRRAVLVRRTTTAAAYRMVALAGTVAKPGLERVASGGGSVEVEVWRLPAAGFGSFVAEIPSPLSIGTLELADGSQVNGFLCESWAMADATDITALGGWRAHLDSLAAETSAPRPGPP